MIPDELRYTESHEWARLDEDSKHVTVGISDFAVEQLGDIVFLELPNIGDQVKKGQPFGTIESVKAASDLYSPVTGKIAEVNQDLTDNLEWLKTDAYRQSWIIKIEIENPAEFQSLKSAAEYNEYVKIAE